MNAATNNQTLNAAYSFSHQVQGNSRLPVESHRPGLNSHCGQHPAAWGGPCDLQPQEKGPSGNYLQTLAQRESCQQMLQFLTGLLMGFLAGAQMGQQPNFNTASHVDGITKNGPDSNFPLTELQRGDSRNLGGNQVDVDASGALSFRRGDTQESAFSFGQSTSGNGCQRASQSYGSLSQAIKSGQKFRVENGQILLPNGKSIPFNNTGAIVVLPDGTQVAVGRQNSNGLQQNRWAVAGAGQEIPCSPAGATSVFRLNENGDVTSTSTK